MNNDTEYLKSIAEEIAANANRENNNNTSPNHHLVVEAKRLEKAITCNLGAIDNFVQRDTFHFDTLSKLVDICDTLFAITTTASPDVMILMDLLTAIRQVIPAEIRPNLRLPKAFVVMQKQTIAENWEYHRKILEDVELDPKLVDIAAIPFKQFLEPKHKLYWGNFTWLKAYEAKLENMDWENADCSSKTEALISLLIGSGFNDDRFFIYCKNIIKDRTTAKSGPQEKLKELAQCRKLILQDARTKSPSYKYKTDTLVAQLLVWITAEEEYVNIHERAQPFSKLHFDWYVNKIAFFFKLLSEQKVFGDTSFRELSQQIASTCLSIGGEEILATTIISKAYPKDQKSLEEMESLLVKKLEYVRSFMRKK
jgi:hypothetical protein